MELLLCHQRCDGMVERSCSGASCCTSYPLQKPVAPGYLVSRSHPAQQRSHYLSAALQHNARRVPEDDPRYRRIDMAERHAWKARQAFVRNLAKGEGGIDLAQACLWIAAEDDAVVSHSSVELPVQAFTARLEALVDEVDRLHLRTLRSATPEAQLEIVANFLFQKKGFALPTSAQSMLTPGLRVDNPGVWEKASYAYLHEVLISKTAIAATLAVLLSHTLQRLLIRGSIDFVVRMDVSKFDRLPVAEILPGMTRASVVAPDGSILNTCASEVLIEVLRHLKRAYWPFPWDTGAGLGGPAEWTGGSGFLGAARVALEGEQDAALQAIARTAKHRQERGIWTSTGGGDVRRAVASAERLAMLSGDAMPIERRDAAVLLANVGRPDQAYVEMQAYLSSPAFQLANTAEARAAEDLQALLAKALQGPLPPPLSVQSALLLQAPEVSDKQRLPLTW